MKNNERIKLIIQKCYKSEPSFSVMKWKFFLIKIFLNSLLLVKPCRSQKFAIDLSVFDSILINNSSFLELVLYL